MAIADTITSMQNHTSNAYTILNYATDLTGTNKNLANLKQCIFDSLINSMSDTLNPTWNNLPKITTTPSTSQSINNTIEAPMRIELGASELEQATTTGKNLLDFTTNNGTYTCTYDSITKIYTSSALNGDWTGFNIYKNYLYIPTGTTTYYFSLDLRLKSGTYSSKLNYFSSGANITGTTQTRASITNPNVSSSFQRYVFTTTFNNTSGSIQTLNNFFVQFLTGASSAVFEVKNLMVSTSSNADYEPYTAGASPNPSYPQDIHTISGDNTILVRGKNLFDKSTTTDGKEISGIGIYNNSSWCVSDYIMVDYNQTYIKNIGSGSNYLTFDKNKVQLNTSALSFSSNKITITDSSVKYIRVNLPISDKDTYQLEVGNSTTTYQAYNGKNYEVNLGVENIATTYKSSGSGYFNYNYDNSKVSNNMTLSFVPDFTTTGATIYARPKDSGTLYTLGTIATLTTGVKASLSFTLTDAQITEIKANTGGFFQIYRAGVDMNQNSIDFIQLEKGTKANTYSPYGQTPINYSKISPYEDKFIRNSGKNLWNESTQVFTNQSRFNSLAKDNNNVWTFTIGGSNGYAFATSTITLPAGTYTASANVNNGDFLLQKDGATINNTFTLTETSTITFRVYKNGNVGDKVVLSQVMLNKGSTPLPYEPYGSNEWYIKKNIGKVVLDGITTGKKFTLLSDYTDCQRFQLRIADCYVSKSYAGAQNYIRSTHFVNQGENQGSTQSKVGVIITWDVASYQYCTFEPNTFNDLASANTWLESNNVVIDYVLDTPTYTQITGTLAEQLENLYNAMSKNGQTNISQVNNDLGFILGTGVLENIGG